MKLLLLALIIIDDSLMLCSQLNHTYTLPVDGDVVQILVEIKALDFGFPKLECLQFEYSRDLVTTNIKYLKSVCIHVDSFVTDKQFLQAFTFVVDDSNVSVSDVKFILVFQNEHPIMRVFFVKLDQVQSKSLLIFITKNVKLFVLRLIDHLANIRYLEFLIKINKSTSFSVVINTIILRSNNIYLLFCIHQEEHWLTIKRFLVLV